MAQRLASVWPIQPQTRAKHALLRHYLNAWLPIITRHRQRALYIDGFAGPGRYANGEDGSPIVALKAAIEHRISISAELVYWFIEANHARKLHLDQELAELDTPHNITVHTNEGTFDESLGDLLDALTRAGGRLVPTFAFIDPFGFSHTPLATVSRLLAQPSCELLINVMYEELNRFLGHPDQEANVDRLFGTGDWRAITLIKEVAARRQMVRDLYEQQLRSQAGARFVRSFEMRNPRGATDYFLFFATNNAIGLEKMKEAMWAVDRSGGFTFFDTTNPQQAVLFQIGPDFASLRRQIEQRFWGQTVSITAVERYVCEETAFLATHFRRILKEMEAESRPTLTIAWAKDGRRRGTFPPGTMLHFGPVAALNA